MALKTALIIPDTHIPYQNIKAYAVMMAVAKDLDPWEIVILGDYADFSSVSFHGRNPFAMALLKEEVEQVNKHLDELDTLFPNAKKVFIEGNHCFRLERYLINTAPALFGLTSVEMVFKLHERPNWKFISFAPDQLYSVLGSKIYARHMPPGSHAKLTATRAFCSLVYGHIHRVECSYAVGLDGKQYVAWSPGWLGDKRKDKVFNYVPNYWQWSLGFGVVTYDDELDVFYHQIINIIEHGNDVSCIYNGKHYKGSLASKEAVRLKEEPLLEQSPPALDLPQTPCETHHESK